jgi:uncharacterized lipoprotein
MRIVLALLAVSVLSGCGWFDRYVVANTTGYSRTCVEGVVYLQFPSGVAPQYNIDGSLKGCK